MGLYEGSIIPITSIGLAHTKGGWVPYRKVKSDDCNHILISYIDDSRGIQMQLTLAILALPWWKLRWCDLPISVFLTHYTFSGHYGVLLDRIENLTFCGSPQDGKDVFIERMHCLKIQRNLLKQQCSRVNMIYVFFFRFCKNSSTFNEI